MFLGAHFEYFSPILAGLAQLRQIGHVTLLNFRIPFRRLGGRPDVADVAPKINTAIGSTSLSTGQFWPLPSRTLQSSVKHCPTSVEMGQVWPAFVPTPSKLFRTAFVATPDAGHTWHGLGKIWPVPANLPGID